MNTLLSRLNAVFAFSLTVLAVLTVLCFLSTAFKDRGSEQARVEPEEANIKVVQAMEHPALQGQSDLGFLTFNLLANFSHLFDWNTKQLFVYVVAEYSTKDNPVNQVVLWDKIILRGESAVLDLSSVSGKYRFYDVGKGLRGNQVNLQLRWNVIPLAGQLPLIGSETYSFTFPDKYSKFK